MKRHQAVTDLNFMLLVDAVAAETGVPRDTAERVLQSGLDVIGRTVAAGFRVRLSNFGSFFRADHTYNTGLRSPDGERVRGKVRVARFRSSGRLREVIRSGGAVTDLRKTRPVR